MIGRCKHRWTPRGTTIGCGWDWYTTVLNVCTICGKARTEKLNGRWELTDLSVATDDGLNELRKVSA